MRLLHIVTSVDPRLGGVAESIRTRGLALVEMGHEIEVASLDVPNSPALRDYPLRLHALGPGITKWYYASKLAPWLRSHAERFDAVVVDGIWQYHGVAARRALAATGVPYFVLPHGMLGPWFKQNHPLKHAKKWVAWVCFDYWVLRNACGVLFSCEEEKVQARRSFWLYRARERVLAFGTAAPPPDRNALVASFLAAQPLLVGKRVLLFLGRIHTVKGIDLLIRAFARVAAEAPDLQLAIAGPGDDALVRELQQAARALSIGERVSWLGMQDGLMKWAALYASEALVLPSHHENFGVVVAEALACGVPALISDKVNIWREIAAADAGFVAPDTVDGTEANLRRWLALGTDQRAQMAQAARQAYERHFRVELMATSLLDAITSMAGTAADGGRADAAATRAR